MTSRRLRPLAARLVIALASAAPFALGFAPAVVPTRADAQRAPIADQYFVNDGVWLRYRVIGTGAPLVMLNTSPGHDDAMLPLARALGTTRRVILLDARGFGTSGRPLEAQQYGAAFVEDVATLLDALGLRATDVLGHATGAVIAAKFAARYPERVRRLVLLDGPVYRDASRLSQQLAPTFASLAASLPKRSTTTTPSSRDFTVLDARPTKRAAPRPAADTTTHAASEAANQVEERRALLAALQSLPSIAVTEREVARLRVPVLAAAGGRDAFADATRALGGWWPGAQSLVVDGVSREGTLTDAKVLASVRAFLR